MSLNLTKAEEIMNKLVLEVKEMNIAGSVPITRI
jgi:hypothetical protein